MDNLIMSAMTFGEGYIKNEQDKRDFIKAVKEKLQDRLVDNFDPTKANGSLFGWLTGGSGVTQQSIIYRSRGDVMKAWKADPNRGVLSLDAPIGEQGETFGSRLVEGETAAGGDAAVEATPEVEGLSLKHI